MNEVPAVPVAAPLPVSDVLIVGGGPAGTTVAARLRDLRPELAICIVDPEADHDYRPGWTLVGAGVYKPESRRRPRSRCIPAGVRWVQARVSGFDPTANRVHLNDGRTMSYRNLIVAAGIETRWAAIEGLEEALAAGVACSIYRRDLAERTWQQLSTFRGGRALFTRPPYPIQCAGSAQSILYLAADHWRSHGHHIELEFLASGVGMHSVPYYANSLKNVAGHYAIDARFNYQLIAVNAEHREAVFVVDEGERSRRVTKRFDFLHVTPPQRPPAFIRTSPLADPLGWVDVDPQTLRHNRYPNVFSLGDCAGLPTSKTVAAIRNQAPVVAENLAAVIYDQPLPSRYDGYSACPIVTSNGKVMLAEFGYNSHAMPSFRADPRVPRRRYWWMKRYYFPYLYWSMLDGRLGIDWHQPLKERRQRVPDFTP
jgi:sulfide:quinone oxidoreductase